MTFDEFGDTLKQRYPGKYDDVPSAALAVGFLTENPKYFDIISPIAHRVFKLLQEQVKPDWHIFGPKKKEAEDIAHILRECTAAASSLVALQTEFERSTGQVTTTDKSRLRTQALESTQALEQKKRLDEHELFKLRNVVDVEIEKNRRLIANQLDYELGQAHIKARLMKFEEHLKRETEEFRANLAIETKRQEARLDFALAKDVALRDLHEIDEYRQHLTRLYDSVQELLTAGIPESQRENRLAVTKQAIATLQRRFDEKFGEGRYHQDLDGEDMGTPGKDT